METEIEIIAIVNRIKTDLSGFYNGNSWVTDNFSTKVLSLPENIALKKLQGYSHSVAELVGHIVSWRNFASQKLTGNDDYDIDDDSAENWNYNPDWNMLPNQFELCHQKLIAAVEKFPADKWNVKVAGRNYSFIFLISGIVQHDYYHYGQIGSLLAAIRRE